MKTKYEICSLATIEVENCTCLSINLNRNIKYECDLKLLRQRKHNTTFIINFPWGYSYRRHSYNNGFMQSK